MHHKTNERTYELSISEINVLKALKIQNLRWRDLKPQVKSLQEQEISIRGLAIAIKKLIASEYIEKTSPSRTSGYRITSKGENALTRHDTIQSINSKDIHYSDEFILKMSLEHLHSTIVFHGMNPLGSFFLEDFPFPMHVKASFFGSEEIEHMIDFAQAHHVYHDHADVREVPSMILEDNIKPIKPHLNETLFNNCVLIGERYNDQLKDKRKNKSRIDINILNFDWGITFRFEGKQLLDKIKRNPKNPAMQKLKRMIEKRLVGTILLNLIFTFQSGCEFIIPAMVKGKLIDKKEGKRLQKLYENIYGGGAFNFKRSLRLRLPIYSKKVKGSKATESSRRELLIESLHYLREGDGFFFPMTGRHGLEEADLTFDKIYNETITKIKNWNDKMD